MMVPALWGPQIVKLELGGRKVTLMAVPALWGLEVVKLELVLQGYSHEPCAGVPVEEQLQIRCVRILRER